MRIPALINPIFFERVSHLNPSDPLALDAVGKRLTKRSPEKWRLRRYGQSPGEQATSSKVAVISIVCFVVSISQPNFIQSLGPPCERLVGEVFDDNSGTILFHPFQDPGVPSPQAGLAPKTHTVGLGWGEQP